MAVISQKLVKPELDRMSMKESILRKCQESIATKQKFFEQNWEQIEKLCNSMAESFRKGRKLFVMGNGGSACDAQHVAVEFIHPIIEKRKPLPVFALSNDIAAITAISNDIDFSRIFVQQLKLMAQPGDMALAISTSGKSPNLIYALETAREKEMLTIAFAGKDGGRMPELAEYCFVVPSFSIHRIQEVHTTLLHIMWDLIHVSLGEEDVI
jgi:D-sedoheptulose 7-phosphate isomerase